MILKEKNKITGDGAMATLANFFGLYVHGLFNAMEIQYPLDIITIRRFIDRGAEKTDIGMGKCIRDFQHMGIPVGILAVK
jgi:hypothetical protein